jgi:hypothetical protein
VLRGRLLAIRVCHVYDDAFITYRYAANLAAGDGLVFHPGAAWEPVLGTTTPGYAVFLAGWIALGFDAVRASLGWNVVFDLVSAVLLLRLLRGRPVAATVALCAFAGMPELARVSAGGMEAPALLCIGLAAVVALQAGKVGAAALLASVACTLRPEAVLLVGVLALEARRRDSLKRFLLPVMILGLLYAGLLAVVYGSPIPQSVSAKASRHSGAGWLDTWSEITRQAWLPSRLYLPALPLVVLGFWRGLGRREVAAPLLRFALAVVVAYLIARPHTWGWYYYPMLAAWTVALGLGAQSVWERALGPGSRREAWEFRLTIAAVPLAALALALATRGRRDTVTEGVYRPLAAWAEEVDLAHSGARVLASDIGALGYYGRGLILDSEGLVWPEAVPAAGDQPRLVREHWPEYLWITAVRAKVQPLLADPEIAASYRAVRRFSARGETRLDVAPESLPDGWAQDYLVYRKDVR